MSIVFYTRSLQNMKNSPYVQKCFMLEHIEWMVLNQIKCFCWWLKDRRLKVSDAHDYHLTYLKKSWKLCSYCFRNSEINKAFMIIGKYEQIQTKVQQMAKQRKDHNQLKKSVIKIKIMLSNHVRSSKWENKEKITTNSRN